MAGTGFFGRMARLLCGVLLSVLAGLGAAAERPRLAYLVSSLEIPFWRIMALGVEQQATALGYAVDLYNADNDARQELQNTVAALNSGIAGLILSPTNSSAAVTILDLAAAAGVPVVIADIGAEAGTYVSYIESDNEQGAYQLGVRLIKALKARGWSYGGVGIVAIPQSRENGQARTRGFIAALSGSGFRTAGIRQQVTFSHDETYRFTRELIQQGDDLRAIWLQGSNRYQAALEAISDEGRADDILLVCFDAEPEFIDMLRSGRLLAAGMQQPRLIGARAVVALDDHRNGYPVLSRQRLPVLVVSPESVDGMLPMIHRNVLGK